MELTNKYNAIFELNNKSPLFARVALDAMNNGQVNDALLILQKGIEIYDDYPTAYFILGKVLIKLNRIDEANDAFKQGDKLLGYKASYNYYLSMADKESSDDPFDLLGKLSHPETLETADNEITETPEYTTTPNLQKEEDLAELAEKLKTAKIEIKDDVSPLNDENSKINENDFKPIKGLVSETLASIYFNQSNYKEAKAIYETLIEIQPERTEYFRNKIAEIESHMRPR